MPTRATHPEIEGFAVLWSWPRCSGQNGSFTLEYVRGYSTPRARSIARRNKGILPGMRLSQGVIPVIAFLCWGGSVHGIEPSKWRATGVQADPGRDPETYRV